MTYECQADFNEKGGQCRTAPQTEEQKIKFDKDFAQWKKDKNEQKEGNKNKNGRQLDGCGSSGCAGIKYVICCSVYMLVYKCILISPFSDSPYLSSLLSYIIAGRLT